MKTFGCILFSAMAIYTLVPTSGYEVLPLHGRDFGLVNLLTSPKQLLSAQIASLQAQITALQNPIKQCPVTGGKTIASIPNKCFKVVSQAAGILWNDAQIACTAGGGTLAEPSPTVAASTLFYTELKAQFPTEFTAIEATNPMQIWIGYINRDTAATATDVIAPISGAKARYVATKDTIIGTAQAAGAFSAVIQAPVGNLWEVVIPAPVVIPKAYVCQYNLL